MDDIIKTLVMVAIVIFSLVSQINKRKKEGSARKPSAHSPNMENREKRRNKEEMEIPEEEGEEEKQEKQRKQEKIIQQEKMNRYQPLSSQPASPKAREKTDRTSSEKKDRTPASDPELTIHSAEEARRAIIWSEILNRKY